MDMRWREVLTQRFFPRLQMATGTGVFDRPTESVVAAPPLVVPTSPSLLAAVAAAAHTPTTFRMLTFHIDHRSRRHLNQHVVMVTDDPIAC